MSTPYTKWIPPPVMNSPELHSSSEAEEQYVRDMEKEADEDLKNIIDSEQRELEELAEIGREEAQAHRNHGDLF